MSYNQNNYYRPSPLGGFRFFPPVIKSLLIINGIVFLLDAVLQYVQFKSGIPVNNIFYRYFALLPIGAGFLPWQLITYQFMHADFFHILFNMAFGLWMFGMEIEQIWGSKKFLFYYLLCGVGAGLAQLLISPMFETSLGPTIGASGAVYGVFIAFAMTFPDRLIFVYFLFPVKVKYFVVILILIGVLSVGGASQVAHFAHLGGAAVGFLYIYFDRKRIQLNRFSRPNQTRTASSLWSRPSSTAGEVIDAKVHDIAESKSFEPKIPQDDSQKKIDEILDKISSGGYQSLTDEEKKILFEASKRMN